MTAGRSGPRSRRYSLRVVMLDAEWQCDACYQLMPPGTVIRLYPDWSEHDEGCPPPWVPVVIEGGLTSNPEQLSLGFLAAAGEGPP